jgi:nitrile hydratase
LDRPQDIGGRRGLGPVRAETDEPVFHRDWERRVFGLSFCSWLNSDVTLDRFRLFQAELPPDRYLGSSYYERWLHALERVMLEGGVMTEAERRSGEAGPDPPPPPLLESTELESTALRLIEGGEKRFVEAEDAPLFEPGQAVTVRDAPARVYDRLPGYLRERRGTIDEHYGSFGNPDVLATGRRDARGAHLYRIRFRADELWGDGAESPADELCVDLFEHYLAPA